MASRVLRSWTRTKVAMAKPRLRLTWLANDMGEKGGREGGARAVLVAGQELLRPQRPRRPRHFEETRWMHDSFLIERFLDGQIVKIQIERHLSYLT